MAALDPHGFYRPPLIDCEAFIADLHCSTPPPGLPPLPPPAAASPMYADDTVKLQASCDGSGPDLGVPLQPMHSVDQLPLLTSKSKKVCSDYDDDLDNSMKAREMKPEERPSPNYGSKVQGGRICPIKRTSLVMWIQQFVLYYDLPASTLHSAVVYVDRFLSVRPLTNPVDYQLRLLGATAAFIAAKFEDQRTTRKINAKDIALYGGFSTAREVISTEVNMLVALGSLIGGPTAYTFVGHFTRYSHGEEDLMVQHLAHRIADQWLHSYESLKFLPSVVAASAIYLARFALKPSNVLLWSTELEELTGYSLESLSDCVHTMYTFSEELICNPVLDH